MVDFNGFNKIPHDLIVKYLCQNEVIFKFLR